MASEYPATTEQLFANAATAMSYASLSAGRIGAQAKPVLSNPTLDYTAPTLNIGAPPMFSDLFSGADPTKQTIADLNDQVDAWLAKYFPAINGEFKNVPEDYLVNVISGTKPFGIDSTIFDLVWQQARDRAYRTVQTKQRSLEQAFSGRGFTLPGGSLIDALLQAEEAGTDTITDIIRDQAVKDADIKADILKNAVAIAAQLKQGLLNTSAEFFRTYYSVYNLNNETARIRAQAYQAFYNALSSYYNVEVSVSELSLRAASEKVSAAEAADRNKIALFGADVAATAQAQAVRGFADIAAAANSAAGSLVAQIENV